MSKPSMNRSLLLLCSLTLAVPALAEAPLSLTASDGSGLSLVQLRADAVVTGPLAFTELHLAFDNPQDRVIEGQFHIVLPPHAVVSRFAMKDGERWQEGEVVEKQLARRAYEDALHRRQDPALLEQGAANEFNARVFPIPARGRKELILSYSQQLASSRAPYQLPLKGLPAIADLDVRVAGAQPFTLQKKGWVPTTDVVVTPEAGKRGLRTGDFLVARVTPVTDTAPQALDSVLFLVDSSASRALGYQGQLQLVAELIGKLPPATPVVVAAFDQAVVKTFQGPASGYDAAAKKALVARRALGASNLEAALAFAKDAGAHRVVLVSDGVATAGTDSQDELAAKVKGLKAQVTRLDAIALGGLRDEAMLHRLVTAGLASDGAVINGEAGADEALRRLTSVTRSKIPVQVEGATFQWPTTLDAMQTNDDALIFAQLPAGAPVKVVVGGAKVELGSLGEVSLPMLERAVVQAKIEALTDRLNRFADGPADKARLSKEIAELSVKHRVLSPYTALLVLETEADYVRYGIDRKALAEILTVEGGRVTLAKRTLPPEPPQAKLPPPPPKKPSPAKEMKLEAKKVGKADDDFMSDDAKPSEEVAMDKEKADDVAPSRAPSAEPAAPPAGPRPEPRPAPAPPPPPPAVAASPSLETRRQASIQIVRDRTPPPATAEAPLQQGERPQSGPPPYTGPFKDVMALVAAKKGPEALAKAQGWREEQPGDVLALVALGEAAEAVGELTLAARAYGSIIDLFPARADLRRFAGVRLERLAEGLALAADSFKHALEERPDHPQSARLYAYALLKQGKAEQAFGVLAEALKRGYPSGRFAGIERILPEDLGLAAAVWKKLEPGKAAQIDARLGEARGRPEKGPSTRFVLNWETDANDVDFHIFDAKGGHAFYSSKQLPSGGELYADVTTGYGPECFTIRGPRKAGPYTLQAHYYSRGPMGYGMGKVEIVEHDGQGTLTFTERPFIVMVDQAFVDLGTVK